MRARIYYIYLRYNSSAAQTRRHAPRIHGMRTALTRVSAVHGPRIQCEVARATQSQAANATICRVEPLRDPSLQIVKAEAKDAHMLLSSEPVSFGSSAPR